MVFSINEQYSIYRSAFEVYKTDEDNFIPYIPNGGEQENSDNQSEDDSSTTEDEGTDEKGFTLHQGEIQEIYYYGNIFSSEHDHDYENIDNNGSISFPTTDKKRFYKGVRTCLKESVESYNEITNYDDMVEVLLGFITEQRFSNDTVDLQIAGMTKLLDRKYQFNFTQMKRSTIVEEIIKTAGLVPVVDFSGMVDEVIDYSNVTSNESDDGGDYSGNVSSDVKAMAKKVCKGKKTAKAKANAITAFICDHVKYPSPNYSDHHKCPSEVLSSGVSNCCDRARLGYEMAQVVKLKARGVHGPGHVWVQYFVDGTWQDSDPGYSRRSLGQVYQNMTMNSLWEFPSC